MDVDAINEHIQQQLRSRGLDTATAIQAAEWLDLAGLLRDSPTRRGLPLRNLLRAGRVVGQGQEPNHRWFIDEVTGEREARAAAREALWLLVDRTIATTRSDDLQRLRGIALYDSQKDDAITALAEFGPAADATASIPLVAVRYGAEQARRLTLQFLYEVGARLSDVTLDESVVNQTWEAFCEELDTPDWIDRGVANVRNFQSDELTLRLGDGVTIRGRSFDELATLGFNDFIQSQLIDDWMGFGASPYVVVVESRSRKEPSNFMSGDGSLSLKALRALGALRLLAPGDVGFGRMWFARPMRFNVGIGGVGSTGAGPDTPGSPFVCSAALASAVPQVYDRLQQLEQSGYADAPGNLGLALRSFMATYDRWPWGRDSQLVDSITALEAVLGTGTEIAYRLASRVSALLAAEDVDRVSVFEAVRGFYNARSEIVHGSPLRKKNQAYLDAVDDLRAFVRRLLLGFVTLANETGHSFDRRFFDEGLDTALIKQEEREGLRVAMGLAKP